MEATTSASWQTILENVRQALAQAEEEANRAAAAWPADPAPLPAEPVAFPALEAGLSQLAAGLAKAEQTVADTETALVQSETALREWLTLAAAVRQKLANGAGQAI